MWKMQERSVPHLLLEQEADLFQMLSAVEGMKG